MFEGLKARLDQLLRESAESDSREGAAGLRAALLEAKLGVGHMGDALRDTERELAEERKRLEDAERRGQLAVAVPDPETTQVAERFAAKHRDRIGVLERKIAVQRDELALAERELTELTALARSAASRGPSDSIDAAWRDIEALGAERPDEEQRLQAELDRRRQEEAVEAQLAFLKRKLGRNP